MFLQSESHPVLERLGNRHSQVGVSEQASKFFNLLQELILGSKSHFRNLGWLRKGHRIELETPEGAESYRVISREIVDPNAVRVLMPTSTRRLTLITCYPFNFIGPAARRLVVVAEPETRVAARVEDPGSARTP